MANNAETADSVSVTTPEQKETQLYVKSQITRNLVIRIGEIGDSLKRTMENKIRALYEGKCASEGIIKPGSSKIVSYSSGKVDSRGLVNITLVIECLICNPPANMIVPCVVRNNTKAGISADSSEETPSPIKMLISREYTSAGITDFSNYKVGDRIMARIIGHQYQLNDPVIYLFGELVIDH